MGFVKSLLGSGPDAPQAAPISTPATQAQADLQYQNAQKAIEQQQAFANSVASQNGLGNQQNILSQQAQLAQQLGLNAAGQGPNPAQAALAQNTSNNVDQQAALMAGQRGSSANAGMMARQIGSQGAKIQQQATGQAATLGAQQQLAAQQALMGQQQAMQGVAGQQIGQQAQALQGLNQFSQGEQSNILSAMGAQNQANVGMQSNINNANAGIQAGRDQLGGKLIGGALSGIGSGVMSAVVPAKAAHGGEVTHDSVIPPHYAAGGPVTGRSFFLAAQGGGQDQFQPMAQQPMMAADGGRVGGEAEVAGDSLKNDKVPAVLSPGEIVLPRSVVNHKNAPAEAAKFVAAVLARGGRR